MSDNQKDYFGKHILLESTISLLYDIYSCYATQMFGCIWSLNFLNQLRSKCFMIDNQTMRVYAYIPDMPDEKVDEPNVVKKVSKIKYKHSCR